MKRILTALFLVPFTIYSVLFAPWPLFVGIVCAVALLCFQEYATITKAFAPLGFVSGLLILIAPAPETTLVLILTALAALCLPLSAESFEKATARAGLLMLGVIYVFGAWKSGILLHGLNPHWLMFGLVVNWFGDTGAYYIGKNFGKRKLAPSVSPGKTWEGAIASLVTAMIFGLIYLPLTIKTVSLPIAGGIALISNVAGQVGDLAESALKRGAGVKDSGTLLPGHGGMLDRVDSSLFTLPVLYTLASFLHS